MQRETIFPAGSQEVYEQYGYSAAIRSGDFLFASGQVGVNEDGSPVKEPGPQIEKAFENLRLLLDAAGCSLEDIVDITSFHVDMHSHFDVFASAKQATFPTAPFPNWTAIGVSTLADPAIIFEIKVVARVPLASAS